MRHVCRLLLIFIFLLFFSTHADSEKLLSMVKSAKEKIKKEKYNEAIPELMEVLKLCKTPRQKARAYNALGEVYFKQKKYHDSLREYKKTLAMKNVSVGFRAVAELGLVNNFKILKMYGKAIAACDRIINSETVLPFQQNQAKALKEELEKLENKIEIR